MNTIKITGNKTRMIAHRGVSKLERENTAVNGTLSLTLKPNTVLLMELVP